MTIPLLLPLLLLLLLLDRWHQLPSCSCAMRPTQGGEQWKVPSSISLLPRLLLQGGRDGFAMLLTEWGRW